MSTSSSAGARSRAERFEDERWRIIDSLFSKRDTDGSLMESYITHIRIIEDAAYPSSPPPPSSPPENKKARLIIIAVRQSGRVRMHKARENANGTFSIGKSWVLDDLSAVRSYTNAVAETPEEAQHKEWANGTGLIVTIQKPYYWEAGTTKEKDFFISSLVKIYRKYTGGKLPLLVGFDQRELEQLTGPPTQQPRGIVASGSSEQLAAQQTSARGDRGVPPPLQFGSRQGPRPQPSRDQMSSRPGSRDPSQRPFPEGPTLATPPPLRTQTSQAQMGRRSESPAQGAAYNQPPQRLLNKYQSTESFRGGQEPFGGRTMTSGSNGSRFAGAGGPVPDSRSNSLRPETPQSNYNAPPSRDGAPSFDSTVSTMQSSDWTKPALPDPARESSQVTLPQERALEFVTPPEGSVDASGPFGPPLGNQERVDREAGQGAIVAPGPEPSKDSALNGIQVTESAASSNFFPRPAALPVDQGVPAPPPVPPSEQKEEEIHRPGLGPMIKKKSSRDVAGAIRKAAQAYNAFKPRAGGAGERLRERSEISNEPDGINAVVPAPSLLKKVGQDVPRSATPDHSGKDELKSQPSIPHLKVTTSGIQDARMDSNTPVTPVGQLEALRARSPTPPPMSPKRVQSMRRKKMQSETLDKQLAALDIDPALLVGRSLGLESVLDEFGWPDGKNHIKRAEALEADMRKELSRVEAGSWLDHVEHRDERVDEVEKLLDKAIAECDELEGLLTLYGVELSTLDDDVAFIEAQSEGLSIRTANERLLQAELQRMLQVRA